MSTVCNRIARRRLILGGFAAVAGAAFPGVGRRVRAAPDDAGAYVASLIDRALKMLRSASKSEERREAEFHLLVNEYFDLPMIARLVLGRYWRMATAEQKQAFSSVFEVHIVKVYASQLAAYDDEEVVVRNVAARTERDTIVATEVWRHAKPPIAIDWLVRRSESGYRVIDVAAEGVSMLTTKRSEFAAVIEREGLEGLIVRLRRFNAGEPIDEVEES